MSAHHVLMYLGSRGAQSESDHMNFYSARYQDHRGCASSVSVGLPSRDPLCARNFYGTLGYMSSIIMAIYASINMFALNGE